VLYTYGVVADDPDDQPSPLAYSLDVAPAGMTIGATTGLIEWTPAAGDAATSPHAVTVRVFDGEDADTQSYAITVSEPSGWWDTGWTERVSATLDMTGIASTLTDFPLLLVLDPTRIDYLNTAPGGADLRVLADDHTTVLPHEIEQWSVGGQSFVWVRVPVVTGGGADTRVWVYYGNGAAADGQDAAAVWTGHRGVWHLTGLEDATGQGHTGVNQGSMDEAAGRIGRARRFDGVDDTVQVAHAPALSFTSGDSFTLSAWVQVETLLSTWQGIVTKSRDSAPWYGVWLSSTRKWVAGGPINLATIDAVVGWTHVAVVQDGAAGQRRIYINGLLGKTGASQPANGPGALVFGGSNGASEFFPGVIDEVRLHGSAVSTDWLAATHRFESNTFITYQSEP
jgi:hypothetical protein